MQFPTPSYLWTRCPRIYRFSTGYVIQTAIPVFPVDHKMARFILYIYLATQENIQSVLASEPQVSQLMCGIEAAITEASLVEARLTVYDEALGRIREAMERVGQKNQAIHTANHNARLLLEQLDAVIVRLQRSGYSILVLIRTDLDYSL